MLTALVSREDTDPVLCHSLISGHVHPMGSTEDYNAMVIIDAGFKKIDLE
jgi:hypothetical protein